MTTTKIGAALLAAQREMPDLQKNAINPHFGSRYISLDSLMVQVLPVLLKHDILLLQAPCHIRSDGPSGIEPGLSTTFFHVPSGESLESTMPLVLDKHNPQGQGSAITYARRYALMSWLGLVADVDDDANAASTGNVVRKNKTAPAPAETPAF